MPSLRRARQFALVALLTPLGAQAGVDVFAASGPGTRHGAPFAVHPRSGEAFVHGGVPGYRWTGTEWVPDLPNCGENATFLASDGDLLVDAVQGRLLAVGGTSDAIWERRNRCWNRLYSGNYFPGEEAACSYDDRRSCIVAYRPVWPAGAETWVWDGSWQQIATPIAPPLRRQPALAYDRRRARVVLAGGDGLSDVWEFDGRQWTPAPPLPAGVQLRRHMLVWDDAGARCIAATPQGLYSYDGTRWLSLTGPYPVLNDARAVAWHEARQELLVFGGNELGSYADRGLHAWNGGAWRRLAPSSTPPDGIGITHARRASAVIVASHAWSSGRTELWERGANGWTLLPSTPNAPVRIGASVTYDARRDRIVMFGGSDSTGTHDDTWEWDGVGWMLAQPPIRPPAREGAAMAYDGARGVVVLFGGRGPLGDTWTWNGVVWSRHAPAVSPPARHGATMAWDPVSGMVVMQGGFTNTSMQQYYETWQWDGSTWHGQAVPTAMGRTHGGIAFDARRGVLVLAFDSFTRTGTVSGWFETRTYVWDGTQWLPDLSPLYLLASGYKRSFAYDPSVQRCVAFDSFRGECLEFGAVARAAHGRLLGRHCHHRFGFTLYSHEQPYLGHVYHLRVQDPFTVPRLRPRFLLIGASASQWGGVALPLDLTALGARGCALRVAPDVVEYLGQWGYYDYWLHLPLDPRLLGTHIYVQDVAIDPLANALGILSGDAYAIAPGLR